uniref:NADH-ubiquinone oxidoreductase chain 3 n=1 Tax=Ammophila sabulosa TaxID=1088610 RepID=A0A7L7SAS4_9HYME|nr:NADH dehydrogenase subunit 3 [Ammophila sabulosa]
MLLMFIIISLLFSLLILFMWNKLSIKTINSREKMSPFECGFNPFNSPRINFSFNFFIISIMFILFDIEISLMLPMLKMWKLFNITLMNNLWLLIIFMFLSTSTFEWM